MKNKLNWSVMWDWFKLFLFRDYWIPNHANQNAKEAAILASKPERGPKAKPRRKSTLETPLDFDGGTLNYQNTVDNEMADIFNGLLVKALTSSTPPPPLTVDGKPNELWVIFNGYAFPDLTREEILAKLQDALDEEEKIVDAFLKRGGENTLPEDAPRLASPQISCINSELQIKLFGQWNIYVPSSLPSFRNRH